MKYVTSEKGLSMIEIMVATLLLFLGLAILMTMLGQAGQMVYGSRLLDRATFLANNQIEWIRSLPYEDIGFTSPSGNEPEGILPRSETTMVAGTQFDIKYDIQWIDDPKDGTGAADTDPDDYKRVIVTVEWSRPAKTSYTIATNISGRQSLGLPPIVNFISPDTPADGSIISGAVNIDVQGVQDTTSAGSPIAFLGLEVGGGILNYGWSFSPPVAIADHEFTWNTAARDTTTNELITPDGQYEVRGIARDNKGLESSISYFYVVNNFPPNMVTTATVVSVGTTTTVVSQEVTVAAGSVGLQLAWERVKDGNDDVQTYRIYRDSLLYQTVTGASYLDADLLPWTTYTYNLSAFSYGDESTRSASLVGLTWMQARSFLKKSGGNYYPRLAWDAPPGGFGVTHYHIFKSTGGAFTDYATTTNLSWEDTASLGKEDVWTYYVVAHDDSHVNLNRSHAVVFDR